MFLSNFILFTNQLHSPAQNIQYQSEIGGATFIVLPSIASVRPSRGYPEKFRHPRILYLYLYLHTGAVRRFQSYVYIYLYIPNLRIRKQKLYRCLASAFDFRVDSRRERESEREKFV